MFWVCRNCVDCFDVAGSMLCKPALVFSPCESFSCAPRSCWSSWRGQRCTATRVDTCEPIADTPPCQGSCRRRSWTPPTQPPDKLTKQTKTFSTKYTAVKNSSTQYQFVVHCKLKRKSVTVSLLQRQQSSVYLLAVHLYKWLKACFNEGQKARPCGQMLCLSTCSISFKLTLSISLQKVTQDFVDNMVAKALFQKHVVEDVFRKHDWPQHYDVRKYRMKEQSFTKWL